MRRQLSFLVSEEKTIDGALTAYARECFLIAALELPEKDRSLATLTRAVGMSRHRATSWFDALRIREQLEDKDLLKGSDYASSNSNRTVRFRVMEGDNLDGALTAYAREWLLLAVSESPAGKRRLSDLAKKVGTSRQRLARWLDVLQIRDKVDELRVPVSRRVYMRSA
jgi:DNA-binding phage protein